MSRAMNSGIAGMSVNQSAMDVISNNIANQTTTAFKGSRTRFQDMLYETLKDANSPSANLGGTNASLIGLGVQIAGVDVDTKQGNMNTTSRNLDAAIDGSGYFVVSKGNSIYKDDAIVVNQTVGTHNVDTTSLSTSGSSLMYTRDGSFTLDSEGNLLTSDGYRVMGYALSNDSEAIGTATAQAPVAVSAEGLTFQFSAGSSLEGYTVQLGAVGAGTTVSADVDTTTKKITLNGDFSSAGSVSSSVAEKAINAALSAKGIAQTVSANGTSSAIANTGSPTINGGDATIAPTITFPSATPAQTTLDGMTFTAGIGSALNGYKIILGNISAGTATSADIDTTNKTITINLDGVAGGETAADITNAIQTQLTKKGISQSLSVDSASVVPSLTGTVAQSAETPAKQALHGGTPVESITNTGVINYVDGNQKLYAYDTNLKSLRIPEKVHDLASNIDLRVKSFSISKDGAILATLENGKVAALGQLATVSFKNPSGLASQGQNLYTTSVNSGEATFRAGKNTAYEDNSNGYGDVRQGMLEMSNVDLAQQFTDMIITSRAFQANGKIINTGDEMLQDVINLKR